MILSEVRGSCHLTTVADRSLHEGLLAPDHLRRHVHGEWHAKTLLLLCKQVVLRRMVVLSSEFGGYILHPTDHGRLLETRHHLLRNEAVVDLRRPVPHHALELGDWNHGRVGHRHLTIAVVLHRVSGERSLRVVLPREFEFTQVHLFLHLVGLLQLLVHLEVLRHVNDDQTDVVSAERVLASVEDDFLADLGDVPAFQVSQLSQFLGQAVVVKDSEQAIRREDQQVVILSELLMTNFRL